MNSGIDWKDQPIVTMDYARKLVADSVVGKDQRTIVHRSADPDTKNKLRLYIKRVADKVGAKFLVRTSPNDGYIWIYRDK